MTDSNGVNPSSEELQTLSDALDNPGVPLQFNETETAKLLIRAELQRRQQPVGEAASVPAELPDDLLWKWFKDSLKRRDLHEFNSLVLRDVAREAAAYGRGQSQQCNHGEVLKWAYSKLKFIGFSKRKDALMLDQLRDSVELPEPPTC